LNNYLRRFS